MNTTPFWKRPWVIALGAIVLVALIVIGILTSSYNGFVAEAGNVDSQWGSVETQYQRRFDLIPGLVSATQGIANQEKDVFTAIAEARTRYAGASSPEEKAEAANQTESAIGRLLVITENYPQLRSSDAFLKFQDEYTGTENRINVARDRYNAAVQSYNVRVQRFPGAILARLFGFAPRTYFQAAAGAETAPKVEF